MTLGALLVVLSYLGGIYSPVRSLARLATTLSRAAASRDRIGEVLTALHKILRREFGEDLWPAWVDALPAGGRPPRTAAVT